MAHRVSKRRRCALSHPLIGAAQMYHRQPKIHNAAPTCSSLHCHCRAIQVVSMVPLVMGRQKSKKEKKDEKKTMNGDQSGASCHFRNEFQSSSSCGPQQQLRCQARGRRLQILHNIHSRILRQWARAVALFVQVQDSCLLEARQTLAQSVSRSRSTSRYLR